MSSPVISQAEQQDEASGGQETHHQPTPAERMAQSVFGSRDAATRNPDADALERNRAAITAALLQRGDSTVVRVEGKERVYLYINFRNTTFEVFYIIATGGGTSPVDLSFLDEGQRSVQPGGGLFGQSVRSARRNQYQYNRDVCGYDEVYLLIDCINRGIDDASASAIFTTANAQSLLRREKAVIHPKSPAQIQKGRVQIQKLLAASKVPDPSRPVPITSSLSSEAMVELGLMQGAPQYGAASVGAPTHVVPAPIPIAATPHMPAPCANAAMDAMRLPPWFPPLLPPHPSTTPKPACTSVRPSKKARSADNVCRQCGHALKGNHSRDNYVFVCHHEPKEGYPQPDPRKRPRRGEH